MCCVFQVAPPTWKRVRTATATTRCGIVTVTMTAGTLVMKSDVVRILIVISHFLQVFPKIAENYDIIFTVNFH